MKLLATVLLLSFGILLISATGPSFEQFFDKILEALIKQKGSSIDPLPIEDQTVTLTPESLKFLPHFVQPEIQLRNIFLKGLKTLHRSGHASQSINFKNNKVTVAELEIAPFEVDIKVYFNFLGLFVGKDVVVDATNFDFFVELEANKTLKQITVPRFEVREIKDLNVRVVGDKVTDQLTNKIMSHAVPLLKKKIIEEVEKAVQQVLESKINELPDSLKNILY